MSALRGASDPRPDFLCIGAQKAGTTWLHRQLSQHAELWLPSNKELHFLDRAWGDRLIQHVYRRTTIGIVTRRRLRLALRTRSKPALQSLFVRRTARRYGRHFDAAGDRLAGEVTPAYVRIPDAVLDELAREVPACKIILILRDPVERAMSHLKMFARRSELSIAEWQSVPASKQHTVLEKSRYLDDLERWERAFGAEQVFVGFFDDLRADPEAFLESILGFLGVSTDRSSFPENVADVLHGGGPESVSDETTRTLASELLAEVVGLHDRFGNAHTQRWLERTRCLAGHS